MKLNLLKAAIGLAGLTNHEVAVLANRRLAADQHLSELDMSKILTGRKKAEHEQQIAIARVLRADAETIFRDSDQE